MSAMGRAICDVLGLDPGTTRTITITIEPGCVPVAAAEQYLFGDAEDEVVKVLRTFDVLERVEEPQS